MSGAAPRAPSPRISRKRAARTEEILDHAMALLAADGLEALTLQRVADASGYVPAALYRYVRSRDGLLAALQRRAIARLHDGYRRARAAHDAAHARLAAADLALARLVHAARHVLDLPRAEPEAWFLIALLLGDPRPLIADDEARATAPLLLAFLADVQALFADARAHRALARGDDLARTLAFWAALQGALALAKLRRLAPAMPDAADVGLAQVEALLRGWGADTAAVRRALARPG